MIIPEFFPEDITLEELEKEIKKIKSSIRIIKKRIKEKSMIYMCPSPWVILSVSQDDLQRAITLYKEKGGNYVATRSEKSLEVFNSKLNMINTISLKTGGFFKGYETRIITIKDDKAKIEIKSDYENLHPEIGEHNRIWDGKTEIDSENIIRLLKNAYVGEWKRHYYNKNVMDGTQWEAEIEYIDGSKAAYDGSNQYPWSFDAFLKIMGF